MALWRFPSIVKRGVSSSLIRHLVGLSSSEYISGLLSPLSIHRKQSTWESNSKSCSFATKYGLSVNLLLVNFCSQAYKTCWSCKEKLTYSSKFCGNCSKLQPLDSSLNFFDVLGIEKIFNVDTKALTRTYRKLQADFHPDRYSVKSEQEQQYALEHSSAVNKAYRCLLHPVERALYLLVLAGQPLHEGQIDMEPSFLMEIMEVNEELAEATDQETVRTIGQRNQEIIDRLLREADAAFSAMNIEEARAVVAKIKYYNNIYEKVREYEREHGIVD